MAAIHIEVCLHNRTFRGRAGDGCRTAWPPSPARLIGALLSGAHRLDDAHCAAARSAIQELTELPDDPLIVAGPAPVELAARLHWYTKRNAPWRNSECHVFADLVRIIGGLPGVQPSKGVKARTVSLLPGDNLMIYEVPGELPAASVTALTAAAHAVTHFGTHGDFASVTVDVGKSVRDDTDAAVLEPAPGGEIAVRCWTPRTVEFYDALFDAGIGRVDADPRVPIVRYRQRSVTVTESRDALIVRALLDGPVPLSKYRYVHAEATQLASGKNVELFPAVDRRDARQVHGLIFSGEDRAEAVASCARLVDQMSNPVLVTLRAEAWSGPAAVWESVTGMVAHRDAFIARREAEVFCSDAGLELLDIAPQPWRHGQGVVPGIGCPYRQWFVRAVSRSGPRTGPIAIGRFTETGAGLLASARNVEVIAA